MPIHIDDPKLRSWIDQLIPIDGTPRMDFPGAAKNEFSDYGGNSFPPEPGVPSNRPMYEGSAPALLDMTPPPRQSFGDLSTFNDPNTGAMVVVDNATGRSTPIPDTHMNAVAEWLNQGGVTYDALLQYISESPFYRGLADPQRDTSPTAGFF